MPVAEHHDGFAMYNTGFNRWNSVNMGPERDVLGELKTAVENVGLAFLCVKSSCRTLFLYEYGQNI